MEKMMEKPLVVAVGELFPQRAVLPPARPALVKRPRALVYGGLLRPSNSVATANTLAHAHQQN